MTFSNPETDWSTAPAAITQELEFCQSWNLGWKVKYHSNTPFRSF